jgi:hypothetical protein
MKNEPLLDGVVEVGIPLAIAVAGLILGFSAQSSGGAIFGVLLIIIAIIVAVVLNR